MRKYALLTVALVLLSVVVTSAVSAQPGGVPRSDGLQMSDFAAPEDTKLAEARNLRALQSKWTEKYCAQMYSGCAAPAQDSYDELLKDLQGASTMPQLNAWRQKAGCVDRCMMEFAPPAPDQARNSCTAGCSVGAFLSK
jgi:hypothetical protein